MSFLQVLLCMGNETATTGIAIQHGGTYLRTCVYHRTRRRAITDYIIRMTGYMMFIDGCGVRHTLVHGKLWCFCGKFRWECVSGTAWKRFAGKHTWNVIVVSTNTRTCQYYIMISIFVFLKCLSHTLNFKYLFSFDYFVPLVLLLSSTASAISRWKWLAWFLKK